MDTIPTGTIIIMVITAHGINTVIRIGTIIIITTIVLTQIQCISIGKAERIEIPTQGLKPGSKVRLITSKDTLKAGIETIPETTTRELIARIRDRA